MLSWWEAANPEALTDLQCDHSLAVQSLICREAAWLCQLQPFVLCQQEAASPQEGRKRKASSSSEQGPDICFRWDETTLIFLSPNPSLPPIWISPTLPWWQHLNWLKPEEMKEILKRSPRRSLLVLAVAENDWERPSLWQGWLQGLPRTVMLYLTRIVTAAQAGKSSAISSAHFGNQFLSFPLSPAKVCSLGEAVQRCWGCWILQ